MKKFSVLLFTFVYATILGAGEHDRDSTIEARPTPENKYNASFPFHAIVSSFFAKVVNEGSTISSRASDDDSSSDSFAKGIWGAFLFSLIGLAAFVAILILLLQYVSGKRKATPRKTTSTENLVNAPRNTAALETQAFPPPTNTTFGNRPVEFESSLHKSAMSTNPSPSPLSVQQFQYQPNYGNQSYFREISTTSGNQQHSHDNVAFSRAPHESSTHIVPVVPPQSAAASSSPEYYSTKTEEPFQYLEKYAPYTIDKSEVDHKTYTTESPTKRAVLRNSTPYKVIEDQIQGEDYDDSESFEPPASTQAPMYPSLPTNGNPNNKPPQLSSDSFNNGKSRLVRVLPRFHHVPSSQSNQQQLVPGVENPSIAVFKPVAPIPPPPPQQFYS